MSVQISSLSVIRVSHLFFLLAPHRCDSGNLNGHYYKGPYQAMTDDGVVWYTWHGWWYSIKSVVMMVRAADLKHPSQAVSPLAGASNGIDHPQLIG